MKISMLLVAFTLVGCDTGYQQNAGKMVFVTWDEGRGKLEHPMPSADANSFQILEQDSYAKDTRHAYYKGQPIVGADSASFAMVSENYAKDAASVFCGKQRLAAADPATFSIDRGWPRDHSDVYFQCRKVDACDKDSFHSVTQYEHWWQRDTQCLYYRGNKVEGVDPASLRILGIYYAKDANRVYYGTQVLKDADPATFDIVPGKHLGRDKSGCWFFDQKRPC